MKAVEILQDEHSAALTVLDGLERAADAAERGAPVPTDVFSDVLEVIQVFVDRCHHGKEEGELFPRLRTSSGGELASRLEAEHEQGRRLAADYAEATRAYTPGDLMAGTRLRQTADAYGDFLRGHIATETAELLPAMYALLEADDEALVEAFQRVEAEQLGPGTHDRLHRMIDGLAFRVERWAHPAATSAY